ncbi:histidine-type phosphatase [Streptomyces sp. NPDC050738]|uniref:histidine-type phosphatase n=1 Tax=Streptomyces sp. NPDC050738 TaxID=3154744 RepID=UPI00342858F6
MRRRLTPALALGVCALLATALPAHAQPRADTGTYGTKAVYAPQQNPRTYAHAPKGFTPVFTQLVSRHGSRAATDGEDGALVIDLWKKADAQGQLTAKGRAFGPLVEQLLAAMEKVGYGNLSARGKSELSGDADRMSARLPALFGRIAKDGEKIDVVTSGQTRAIDSGTEFTSELAALNPELKPLIGPSRTDKDLLYFHKAAGGAAYRDYIDTDQRLAATLAAVREQPATHRAARAILRGLFTDAFVDSLGDADGSDVAAAQAVYNLYAIAPAMSQESPDGHSWHLERYVPHSAAAWFGYLGDAEDFYEKGPGFTGSDITYKMAEPLLDDLFTQVEAVRAGTSDRGAVLRFTHAEEIIPLAALMRLPGSTVAAAPDRPYTYKNNPWRGAEVSSLGANIQWDVFRKGGTYLVRMLYNEKETAFRAGCTPVAKGSTFYDLDELESCFGRTS